jgi:hypothetical protein
VLVLYEIDCLRNYIYRVSEEERSLFWEVIVSVILSKQKSVYVHVSCSERFLRFHCTVVHSTVVVVAARHVLTRFAKCTDVDGGILKNVLY